MAWGLTCAQEILQLQRSTGLSGPVEGYQIVYENPLSLLPITYSELAPKVALPELPPLNYWDHLAPGSIFLKMHAKGQQQMALPRPPGPQAPIIVSVVFRRAPYPEGQAETKESLHELERYRRQLIEKRILLSPDQSKQLSREETERIGDYFACLGIHFVLVYSPTADRYYIELLESGTHPVNLAVAKEKAELHDLRYAVDTAEFAMALVLKASFHQKAHSINLGFPWVLDPSPEHTSWRHETYHARRYNQPRRDLGMTVRLSKPLPGFDSLYTRQQGHDESTNYLTTLDWDKKLRMQLFQASHAAERNLEIIRRARPAFQNSPQSVQYSIEKKKGQEEVVATWEVNTLDAHFQINLPLWSSEGPQDPKNSHSVYKALSHLEALSRNHKIQTHIALLAMEKLQATSDADLKYGYVKAIQHLIATVDWEPGAVPSLDCEKETESFNQQVWLHWLRKKAMIP